MPRFPVDAPKAKLLKALKLLGFRIVREREHIARGPAVFSNTLTEHYQSLQRLESQFL
jgi:hypothetical protein